MTDGYTTLRMERDGAVMIITLDRPDAANSINAAMASDLLRAATTCDEDDTIRCVILTGQGRFFCAGGEIAGMVAAPEGTPAYVRNLANSFHQAISRLARMAKPLITAINGTVAGGGVGLAILGDVALAGQAANFTLAYQGLGFTPDGGATWLLPRLVGLRRAQDLMITNRRVQADEAAQIGLVTRVVADDELMQEATALAQKLSRGPTQALARTRQLILDGLDASLEAQMAEEARTISAASTTPHGTEGLAAFLEKRKPDFR